MTKSVKQNKGAANPNPRAQQSQVSGLERSALRAYLNFLNGVGILGQYPQFLYWRAKDQPWTALVEAIWITLGVMLYRSGSYSGFTTLFFVASAFLPLGPFGAFGGPLYAIITAMISYGTFRMVVLYTLLVVGSLFIIFTVFFRLTGLLEVPQQQGNKRR